MPERSTITTVSFLRPFSLSALDGMQPAGTYTVETIDTTLDDLSFVAYRRVSTAITVPALGVGSLQRQVVYIDPLELDVALKRDEALTRAESKPNNDAT